MFGSDQALLLEVFANLEKGFKSWFGERPIQRWSEAFIGLWEWHIPLGDRPQVILPGSLVVSARPRRRNPAKRDRSLFPNTLGVRKRMTVFGDTQQVLLSPWAGDVSVISTIPKQHQVRQQKGTARALVI